MSGMSDGISKAELDSALTAQTDQVVGVLNDFMDQVANRFTDIDRRLQYVEENMATKESIDHLVGTMDDFIRRITDNDSEQAARDAQWNRLLEWAREVSKKTGVPMPDL